MSDDAMWKPVTRDDVTDLALLPGEMRAFRSEMRDEMRAIARALEALTRIEERLVVVIDRQNVLERQQALHASQIADLSRWQSQTDERLAALETKPKRRSPARKR